MTISNLRALSQPAPKNDKAKSNAAHLKQFYGLRKGIIELRISIERLYNQVIKTNGGHS